MTIELQPYQDPNDIPEVPSVYYVYLPQQDGYKPFEEIATSRELADAAVLAYAQGRAGEPDIQKCIEPLNSAMAVTDGSYADLVYRIEEHPVGSVVDGVDS